MDELLAKRVKAAAVSCWWTLLIGVVILSVAYGGYLSAMCARPEWMLKIWGGGELGWAEVQKFYLAAFILFKLMLFGVLMAAIWMSLLARRLNK